MIVKKCPYCGFENEQNATVCEKCKAELPQETEGKARHEDSEKRI